MRIIFVLYLSHGVNRMGDNRGFMFLPTANLSMEGVSLNMSVTCGNRVFGNPCTRTFIVPHFYV